MNQNSKYLYLIFFLFLPELELQILEPLGTYTIIKNMGHPDIFFIKISIFIA